jgi:hypothetical protein
MKMTTAMVNIFEVICARAFMIVMIIIQTHSYGAFDPSLSRDTWFKEIMSEIEVMVPMCQIFHMDLSPCSWNPFQKKSGHNVMWNCHQLLVSQWGPYILS